MTDKPDTEALPPMQEQFEQWSMRGRWIGKPPRDEEDPTKYTHIAQMEWEAFQGGYAAGAAAERATLPCGHPASLMLKSAETGADLYCKLCDAQSARRDAEEMEDELRAKLAEAEETIRNLSHALREEIEAPAFDPEGVAPSAAARAEPTVGWKATDADPAALTAAARFNPSQAVTVLFRPDGSPLSQPAAETAPAAATENEERKILVEESLVHRVARIIEDEWGDDSETALELRAAIGASYAAPVAPAAASVADVREALTDLYLMGHNDGARPVDDEETKAQCMHAAINLTFGRIATPPAHDAPAEALSDAARDVLAERKRQVDAEGWTADHDDEHVNGGMAVAAACYAITARQGLEAQATELWDWTGWAKAWFKPKDPRRNLIRAGALILAEIERLDRLRTSSSAKGAEGEPT